MTKYFFGVKEFLVFPHCARGVHRCTVWKLQNFPGTQILHEIKIGESRVSKSAMLTNWETEFWIWLVFALFCRLKFTNVTKFRSPKIAKMAVLELLDSPKFLSRKICEILQGLGSITFLGIAFTLLVFY